MSDTYTEAPSQVVNRPVLMADDTIARLNSEGSATNYEPLQTINKSRDAMGGLQSGQVGIVIGSGDNTESWKQKGWKTCDVNPKFNSDYTIDANDLQDVIPDKSQDFVLAECLTFDKYSKKGVSPSRLLNQANKVLKMNGIVIIETANFENIPTAGTPKRDEYLNLMASHGFNAVAEVHRYHEIGNGQLDQKVIYYGKKVTDEYVHKKIS